MIQTERQFCVYCRYPVSNPNYNYHEECQSLIESFEYIHPEEIKFKDVALRVTIETGVFKDIPLKRIFLNGGIIT